MARPLKAPPLEPRLEPCEETTEDVLVWLKLSSRMHERDRTSTPVRFRCLAWRSQCSDRRDAELMLSLEQIMPAVKVGNVWARAHRRMTIGIGTFRGEGPDAPWERLRPCQR